MRIYLQKSIEETCGCYWPKIDIVDQKFDSVPCNMKQTLDCYHSVRLEFDSQNKYEV